MTHVSWPTYGLGSSIKLEQKRSCNLLYNCPSVSRLGSIVSNIITYRQLHLAQSKYTKFLHDKKKNKKGLGNCAHLQLSCVHTSCKHPRWSSLFLQGLYIWVSLRSKSAQHSSALINCNSNQRKLRKKQTCELLQFNWQQKIIKHRYQLIVVITYQNFDIYVFGQRTQLQNQTLPLYGNSNSRCPKEDLQLKLRCKAISKL